MGHRLRIAVTGPDGMLGRRVVARAAQTADVVPIAERSDGSVDDPTLVALERAEPDWVINCAGQLGQSDPDLFIVNSLLPHRLAARWPGRVILASSDAVFTSRGNRGVSERPDASDAYGLSKRLGEAPGAHIIRCSIVDPKGGLLARVAASERLTGYVNHLWNGITTESWAALAMAIVDGELGGTIQPAGDVVTKFDLLQTAVRVFGWRTIIDRAEADEPVDRTLLPTVSLDPIEVQLAAMATALRAELPSVASSEA